MVRELKLTDRPVSESFYSATRGEILASLGAIDGDVLVAIQRGHRSEYRRLDLRRDALEGELFELDEWAKDKGLVR